MRDRSGFAWVHPLLPHVSRQRSAAEKTDEVERALFLAPQNAVTKPAAVGGMNPSKPTPSVSFRALDSSYQLISALVPVLAAIGKHDRSLKDQLRRAATSIPLNLAEGWGLQGGNQKMRFLTALGSAREVAAILEVARRWRYLPDAQLRESLSILDEVAAQACRLVNPRR